MLAAIHPQAPLVSGEMPNAKKRAPSFGQKGAKSIRETLTRALKTRHGVIKLPPDPHTHTHTHSHRKDFSVGVIKAEDVVAAIIEQFVINGAILTEKKILKKREKASVKKSPVNRKERGGAATQKQQQKQSIRNGNEILSIFVNTYWGERSTGK